MNEIPFLSGDEIDFPFLERVPNSSKESSQSEQSSSEENDTIDGLKIIADPGFIRLAHEKELSNNIFSSSDTCSDSSYDTEPNNTVKRRKFFRKRVKKFFVSKQYDSDGYFDAPHFVKNKRLVKKRKGSRTNPIYITDSDSD